MVVAEREIRENLANITIKKAPRPTLRSGRGSRINCNTSHQIPARVIEAESACAASMPAPARFSISNVRYLPECGHPLKYPLHLSGFFSPFQNLNSLDDTKS